LSPSLCSLYQRNAFLDQFESEAKEVVSIHREHLNGCASYHGPPCDASSLELKVCGPEVSPRMKQAHEFARRGIESRYVPTFVAIAMRAGESKILDDCFSLMLFGDNMIDLERQRKSKFRDMTVFAASSGPIPHRPSQLAVNGQS
jgi:hypothetical protein